LERDYRSLLLDHQLVEGKYKAEYAKKIAGFHLISFNKEIQLILQARCTKYTMLKTLMQMGMCKKNPNTMLKS
jgi:hypothetical protein